MIIDVSSPLEIGKLIRNRRVQKAVGRNVLAAAAGISENTLLDIEGGKRDLKVSTLVKLANALDIRLAFVPGSNSDGDLKEAQSEPR